MSCIYSIPSLREPEGFEAEEQLYSSTLNVEMQTEVRQHTPGAKPRVDYALAANIREKMLYNIPTETKKKIVMKDLAQMA